MNKKGKNALAGHWGCEFGIRNEHHTLYFTMIYVYLTIIIGITTIRSTFKKQTLQRINICLQSSHSFFGPAACFVFLQPPFFVLKSVNNDNKLHGPFWRAVLKLSGRYYTPPHPPDLSRSEDMQHTCQQRQQVKCSKRSTQQLHGKTAARLEALAPKTT